MKKPKSPKPKTPRKLKPHLAPIPKPTRFVRKPSPFDLMFASMVFGGLLGRCSR